MAGGKIYQAALRPDGTLDQDKYYRLLKIQKSTKNVNETLAAAEGLASVKRGTPTQVQVQKGDTLESIAKRYSFEGQHVAFLDAIARANGLYFSDGVLNQNVSVGSYLNIPTSFQTGRGVNLGSGNQAGTSGGVPGTTVPQTPPNAPVSRSGLLDINTGSDLQQAGKAPVGVSPQVQEAIALAQQIQPNRPVVGVTGQNNAQTFEGSFNTSKGGYTPGQLPQNGITAFLNNLFNSQPLSQESIQAGLQGAGQAGISSPSPNNQFSPTQYDQSAVFNPTTTDTLTQYLEGLSANPASNPAVTGQGQSSAGQLADAARYTAMAIQAARDTNNRTYLPDEMSAEMAVTVAPLFGGEEVDVWLEELGYRQEAPGYYKRYDPVVTTGGYTDYQTRAYTRSASRSRRSGGARYDTDRRGNPAYQGGYGQGGLMTWRIGFG